MHTYLDTCFAGYADGEIPDGWTVEQHADRFHRLGDVRAGAYWILFPGNKHLPPVPPLRDVVLTLQVAADAYSRALGLLFFFRYDPVARAGYVLRWRWSPVGVETVLGACRGVRTDTLARTACVEPAFPAAPPVACALRFEMRGARLRLWQDGRCAADFEDAARTFDRPGAIAFDRPVVRGNYGVALRAVRLDSDEPVPDTELWSDRAFEVPADLNGMTTPFVFRVRATRAGGRARLEAVLAGGPPEGRSPVHALQAQRQYWPNSVLQGPYLRLECPGGQSAGPFYLRRGTVGLRDHWNPHSSGFLPADTECPVRATFYPPDVPADAVLVVGYDRYAAEDRLALAGGPSEAWFDPRTGALLYAGPALGPGALTLEVESPADKKIGGLLPHSDLRYAQALAFARHNHFFFESEPVRFRVRARRRAAAPDALLAWVQLENVFREPLGQPRCLTLVPTSDPGPAAGPAEQVLRAAGIEMLATDWFNLSGLAVGVYHVRVTIAVEAPGGGAAAAAPALPDRMTLRKAFEVMADDPAMPSPPQASGLPDLVPYLDSYGTDAGMFDPWIGRGVNESHYLATAHVQPAVARRDRVWDVIHLYRRRWMTDLAPHVTPTPGMEANRDILRTCDRVWIFDRKDLWIPDTYADPVVRNVLEQFLARPDPGQAGAGGALTSETLAREGRLTEPLFRDLLARHWKDWLAFFNRWNLEHHLAGLRAQLAGINPGAQLMAYGVYPPYGATYKSAYFPLFMGRDPSLGLERVYDGPMIFEDYPYMSGYPLQRGVFMLAALKLAAPRLRLFPEIYGVAGFAGDSRPRYGCPPYGHFPGTPPGCLRKTVFEYVWAAAWFDTGGFHFWDDRGFNAQDWPPSHFDELLDAWAIVSRCPPYKPLRTAAFCYSREACLAHPDLYQDGRGNPDFEPTPHGGGGDLVNTAEEAVPFAYEQARLDGQPAGFVTALEHLDRLDPCDVHTLVLPPLGGVPVAHLAAIRRLHERGVALLGVEDVSGLEDLFGVAPLPTPEPLRTLAVAAGDHPLQALRLAAERCDGDACAARYRLDGAAAWLDGLTAAGRPVPVLAAHRTRWGRTACFTIPPTLVRRADLKALVAFGKESISPLVNAAVARVLRALGDPAADTTAGKLIGFEDRAGGLHLVVMEDALPARPAPIAPTVTVRGPGVGALVWTCDRPCAVLERQPDRVRFRLDLGVNDAAHLRGVARPGCCGGALGRTSSVSTCRG